MSQEQSSQLPKTQFSWEEFEPLLPEKVEARQGLLVIPLEAAQELVEQTLYLQYCQFQSEDSAWEESMPTTYGDIDYDLG